MSISLLYRAGNCWLRYSGMSWTGLFGALWTECLTFHFLLGTNKINCFFSFSFFNTIWHDSEELSKICSLKTHLSASSFHCTMKCLGFFGDLTSIWSLLAKSGTMFWFANNNGTLYIDLQSWTSITCNTHAKYSSDLQGCHRLWRWKMSRALADMGLRQWHKKNEIVKTDKRMVDWNCDVTQKSKNETMRQQGGKKNFSWKVTMLPHQNFKSNFWFYESLKTCAS